MSKPVSTHLASYAEAFLVNRNVNPLVKFREIPHLGLEVLSCLDINSYESAKEYAAMQLCLFDKESLIESDDNEQANKQTIVATPVIHDTALNAIQRYHGPDPFDTNMTRLRMASRLLTRKSFQYIEQAGQTSIHPMNKCHQLVAFSEFANNAELKEQALDKLLEVLNDSSASRDIKQIGRAHV